MAGTLTISTLSDGTNSTSSTNCIQGSAKAWVNFNGITTATVRASYNVSSVTRTGTGLYTISFTNAFSDANYCMSGLARPTSNGSVVCVLGMQDYNTTTYVQTASAAYIGLYGTGGSAATADTSALCVSFFR